jgi:mono/diheme cytochrome c family protein
MIFAATLGFTPPPLLAADLVRGKALYDNHCIGCHEDTVHKRELHKAASYADIEQFVLRWEREMSLKWTAEERADVAAYLNDKFYKY